MRMRFLVLESGLGASKANPRHFVLKRFSLLVAPYLAALEEDEVEAPRAFFFFVLVEKDS